MELIFKPQSGIFAVRGNHGRSAVWCRYAAGGEQSFDYFQDELMKTISTLVVIALLWLFIASLLMLMLWPDWPNTSIQWFLLLGLGPPVYVLGEAFFGWLLSRDHGDKLSPRRFSVVRIIVALPVVLGVFALGWWVTGLLSKV